MDNTPTFTPTDLIAVTNQTLEYSFSSVLVEGEVASFKINQGKWVFFDLKDEESSVSCFMTLWDLRVPIEDGMKVVVRCTPKLTKWGKFSLTVQKIQPVGEGSLKKSFELLKQKLEKEGLFDRARKRPLPKDLTKLGVISSTGAAGYADFIKIVNARWGGLKITVAHTQVQGLDAPDQIIRALQYFNEHSEVEVIAILRGGGSADDLSCFNDEKLARAIASSKIPVITGIGHEIDESLADLVADVRASTPSNAAELLTRDRAAEAARVRTAMVRASRVICNNIDNYIHNNHTKLQQALHELESRLNRYHDMVKQKLKLLEALNPEKILRQGYAILQGKISPGSVVKITTLNQQITAEIKEIEDR